MEQPEKPKVEQKAGYLILRIKPREGLVIMEQIEVRLASIDRERGEVNLAIRAPKDFTIRKVK